MGTGGQGEVRSDGGVVVLLFTDVVGSTRLLDRLGDDANEELRRTHFSLLREAVRATGGREVKSLGDGLMVAFASPVEALGCAVQMQQAIAGYNGQRPEVTVEIRVGLHLGDPPRDEDDFFGTPVVIARRLCDRAAGGQILASELLAGVVGTRGGYRFRRLGLLSLKGLADPVATVGVEWQGSRAGSEHPGPPPSRPSLDRGPRLVGRAEELAILRAELVRASAGELRCVLLLADAGMGKTRLSAELVDGCDGDALILRARAYPFGQTASFGLWSEAFERHLRRLSVQEIAEVCGGFLDDMGGLVRSVAAARGAAPEGELPPRRLMDGLAALLANLARAGPVVVAFDDVHLADASSWEALHYLAHSLSDTPVLVVATARPAELAAHRSAVGVVNALEQDGQLRRLVLAPVERLALAELCQGVLQVPPPEPLVEWLVQRSGGNPLFALGLLGALVDEGADLSAPRLRRLPEALSERVAGRLADLDAEALAIVEVLAVVARPLPLMELARLGERSLDDTSGAAHRLIRARFVTIDVARPGEQDDEPRYDLAHPLLQEVVYDRTGPGRRRALHRLAARSLLALGRVGDAASHFARGAEVGDPEAVDALREALREAEERRAHLEAMEILVILVDLLPADDERWFDIVHTLSTQAFWTTDHRLAAGHARGLRAMRFVESVLEGSPDLARRAAVKYRLARYVGWGIGDSGESLRLARQARDLYEAVGDQPSTVIATGGVAHLCGLAGDQPALEIEAGRALSAAESLGQPRLAINALAALYRTAALQARFDDVNALGDRLVPLARTEPDSSGLAWVLTVTAATRAAEGRLSEVDPILTEIRSLSPGSAPGVLLAWDVGIRWMAGDIPRARESLERCLASRWDPWHVLGAGFATMVAVEADRPAEAQDHLTKAQDSFATGGWSYMGPFVDHAAAVLAWRCGEHREALAAVRETAGALLAGGWAIFATFALLDQAEWAAIDASGEAAREAAARLDQLAAIANRDLYQGYAAFGGACAALASAHPGVAAASAEEAVGVASSLGYRLVEGRALVLLGRARTRADRPGAVEALERAVAVFDACGAVWRREETRALLRALGSRGRKAASAGSGPNALTRREREVAQLAVKGHTARQIADVLFVGERTVEGHLASVYTKLGLSSKVDLARRADELGL